MINFNVIAALAILCISCSFGVYAEKSHQQKYKDAMGEQMHVKCYVEYRGGGDDIRFAVGDFKTPNQAKALLHSRKVVKNNGKTYKNILKVKECVKSTEQFSTSQAKNLDKSVAR